MTKGYKVGDIENVLLTQSGGMPVRIKDVARVYVGNVPRLSMVGKDHDDDVVEYIVVMGRTFHTQDIVPRMTAEIDKMNHDGSLPPGVKVCPFTTGWPLST